MNVAYIRVSTTDQNEGRQLEAMEGHNIEKIFMEKASAKDANRPMLNELKNFVREGDSVYIQDFSRLARSTQDLLSLIDYFSERNIPLISLKENFDTSTPTGKLMVTVMGAINEFERSSLLERQREGIALAKAKGAYKGRKKIKYPDNWVEIYELYKTRKITGTKAMELLGLKRNTFYSLKSEYEVTNDGI